MLHRLLAVAGGGGGFTPTVTAHVITPVYNVHEDYSDDIQAAHDDAMSAGGGIVYLPTGSYTTSSTTLELAYPVTFIGDGRGASIIDTGTANPAVRFKNPATSVQRNGCHIGGMTIHGTGSVGLTPKGLSTSVITEIELYGYTTALTLDGSYSGTIGSWHNTISDFNIHDVQDAIKLTGAGFPNGRANENHIGPGRIIDFTGSGVWIDSGDNNTIQMVDFAQLNISLGTSAGVSIHDILTKVWGCRFDPVHIGIDMISGAENAFRDNYFTGCDYGIKTSGGTGIVDGGYYSGNGTDVSDPGSHLTTR